MSDSFGNRWSKESDFTESLAKGATDHQRIMRLEKLLGDVRAAIGAALVTQDFAPLLDVDAAINSALPKGASHD